MAEIQSSNTVFVGTPPATDSAGERQIQQRGPPLHQIYALPAPIRTFPLPTFYPNNPLSFFHVAYAWLGQLLSPPKAEPSVVYRGVWSAATTSVHITDDVSTRALWEQGFYGKGSLSRSEPAWLKREQVRQGLADAHVSEIVTVQRREERMRAKWERARLEQEAIRETRRKEAEEAEAREIQAREAKAFEAKERALRARESKDIAQPRSIKPISLSASLPTYESPVSPAALLALPNSLVDIVKPTPIKPINLPVSTPTYASPVCPATLLVMPNSAAEVEESANEKVEEEIDGLGISGVHPSAMGLTVDTLLNGSAAGSISTEAHNGARHHVTNGTSVVASSSDEEDNTKPKKRRKSVRFSPEVESTTFHFADPPSPKRATANGTANGIADIRAASPVALNGHKEEKSLERASKPVIKNMEHLQLMPEEAFFLNFGLGALTVTDPSGAELSSLDLLRLFRQYSYFPPRVEPQDPALQPDDNFLIHYAVYHHFRSLGWVPRAGIKFGVDWLLYAKGPVFDHAEFGLIVVPSYSDHLWKEAGKQGPQKTWQWLHGIVRVLSHVMKSLVLVYVDVPPPAKFEKALDQGVAEALKLYTVREVMVKRWSANRNRKTLTTKNYGIPPLFQPTTTLSAQDNNLTISSGDRFIQIQDEKHGGWTRLDATILRDSCTCTTCVDPASGQKSFATTAVPSDIAIDSIRTTSNGVGISFKNDMYKDHEMILPWSVVDKALGQVPAEKMPYPRQDAVYPKTGRTFWDKATIKQRVRKIDYHEFMKGDDAFWHTLLDLSNLGLVFLKNVPHDEKSIVSITTRIANIKETFYGRTFDVRAKPDAENVAYTSGYLGLHQDLLYLESPPAIQLLHCMENSCNGGESLFSDGLFAGKLLWLQKSPTVKNLARVKIPYHYEKHGYFYRQQRSLFDVGPDGNLAAVYWSPPFQNQFQVPAVDARAWLEPAQLFDGLINDPDAMFEMKMKPGECVLFDNLRVMHGRNQFDVGGGSRWLRGAYIAREDLVSRVLHVPEVLAAEYRGGKEWSHELEDEELKGSEWFGKVEGQVERVVDGLKRKGASELGERDYEALNLG
ncbi:tRNA-splicing endonuclease beta chain [Fusarium beomiforme]|uniref:tRNA-intron lyase n=1 Tax=Fusarium beomiforme TaxID=44412 RepID=A0A9P5AL70_9HYPO|nr:tRNA-splicing endonuclease beta chain [Fusarium beomiforme]